MKFHECGPTIVFALLISTPALAQNAVSPAESAVDETLLPYADTEQSVDLPGGREFHMVCMGEGSPTVILSAGQGDWSAAWSKVQPQVARTTQVCSWDRPGFGLSDGTAFEPTVETNASDLKAALVVANIPGPYVLVGHSLGSYETLLFADSNPEQVVGMILIDPSIPDQPARMANVAPTLDPAPAHQQGPAALWHHCADQVRSGDLTANGPDPDGCFAFPPQFPPSVRAALKAKLASSPVQFETAAAFFAGALDGGAKIVINPERDYGDMPLIVLTSTDLPLPPDFPAEERARLEAMVEESHKGWLELASLSTRGTNGRVPVTGHYIHQEKPQVVIDTIEAVVREVRDDGAD
tara:strand:- start:50854 stop:51912 length:1059 start_codon:yes stop_codon:yes gene_type:complete